MARRPAGAYVRFWILTLHLSESYSCKSPQLGPRVFFMTTVQVGIDIYEFALSTQGAHHNVSWLHRLLRVKDLLTA